jgi:hypothetical protein
MEREWPGRSCEREASDLAWDEAGNKGKGEGKTGQPLREENWIAGIEQ